MTGDVTISRRALVIAAVVAAAVAIAVVIAVLVVRDRRADEQEERGHLCTAAMVNGYDWAIEKYCDD